MKYPGQGYRFTKSQRNLVRLLTNKDGIHMVQGDAGSGKTTSFNVIEQICDKENIDCIGISLTGKAVSEMNDVGISKAFTIDSFLNKSAKSNLDIKKESVLLSDEASMIGNLKLKNVLEISKSKNLKTILVGDKKQLQSISAGRCHDMLWNKTSVKKLEMNEILRQKEGSDAHKIVQTFKAEYAKDEKEQTTPLCQKRCVK